MKCKNSNCEEKRRYGYISCSRECENQIRINNRTQALEYLGGRCKRCGSDENTSTLQFHHLDPCDKRYSICRGLHKGFNFIQSELNKCILLCLNCHETIHAIKDSNYFIINNYFFSYKFENLDKNLGIDNNDECTKINLEKGKIKNRDSIIPLSSE